MVDRSTRVCSIASMSDLFRVKVEANEGNTVRLRLHIISLDEITFPLSPSFAMMLLEDEGAPGRKRFSRWLWDTIEADEWFNSSDHVVSITLLEHRGLPRAHGEPPAGMTHDDVDASEDPGVLGDALYEIVVDAEGMLAHLEPGDSWGSTAYDEAGHGPLFLGAPGDPTQWRKES